MAEPNTNAQGAETTGETSETKTYTQEQVNSMIGERLARERSKYPSDEELNAFHTWQKEHETEADKHKKVVAERDELTAKLATATAEIEGYKREKYVSSKGVTGDEAEFIVFKAAKMVSKDKTFEVAVDELLKERKPKAHVNTGADLGTNNGGAKTANETFNALIRSARR